MVDWITAQTEIGYNFLPRPKWFDSGVVEKIDPRGLITKLRSDRYSIDGSYSGALTFVSREGTDFWLECNPTKFFQGHNLFGTDDAVGLFFEAGNVFRQRGVAHFPSPATFNAWDFSPPRFTRVDLTRSYRFPNRLEANAYLRNVVASSRSKHGSSSIDSGTAYFQKHSTHWSMKVYSKHDEINSRRKGHKLQGFSNSENRSLHEWAEGVLRFELTLRSPELNRLHYPYKSPSNYEIFSDYYNRITWNGNAMTNNAQYDLSLLTTTEKFALVTWRNGEDVRVHLPKTTFYRTRKSLMEIFNIDISLPCVVDEIPTAPISLTDPNWDPEPISEFLFTPKLGERYLTSK